MWDLLKKYWDIISGALTGLVLCLIAKFELEAVQLVYSVVIVILVCIGFFKIVRQSLEKRKEKIREKNLLDSMVDKQKPIKAIRIAQEPMRDGEQLGNLTITIIGGLKKVMKKVQEWFDKFKGYILTLALAALTAIEMCGGFINQLCGGVLTVNGVELLPVITLVLTAIVGIISNGFTKEQMEKIKALFSKSTTSEMVKKEIKNTLKVKNEQLTQFNKVLAVKEHELSNLNSELEGAKNTHDAKKEMYNMIPQLATAEDVKLAEETVSEIVTKISAKNAEIEEIKKTIEELTTTIGALKSQL